MIAFGSRISRMTASIETVLPGARLADDAEHLAEADRERERRRPP